jgi:hypothetical protein
MLHQSTVCIKVVFVLQSAEVWPMFQDLYDNRSALRIRKFSVPHFIQP